MNAREGMRRLGILLGTLGAVTGGFLAYLNAQPIWNSHRKFEAIMRTPTGQSLTKAIKAYPVPCDPEALNAKGAAEPPGWRPVLELKQGPQNGAAGWVLAKPGTITDLRPITITPDAPAKQRPKIDPATGERWVDVRPAFKLTSFLLEGVRQACESSHRLCRTVGLPGLPKAALVCPLSMGDRPQNLV
jgi:hypothetical protein